MNSRLPGVASRRVFNYPDHSAVASWQAGLPGGLLARSRLDAGWRLGREPNAVWDIYVTSSRGRLRPFHQLTNLTDTVHQEISGVAMPGRAALAGLEIAILSGALASGCSAERSSVVLSRGARFSDPAMR